MYTIYNNKTKSQSKDFWKTKSCDEGCNKVTYVTTDPRARDFYNNINMQFDRAPYQCTLNSWNFDELYNNPEMNRPTYIYNNYSDVNIGDITYYVDRQLQTPYPKEIFAVPSQVVPVAYMDPISRVNVEYVKIPTVCPISPYQETQDQVNFRDDLIALMSIKMNKQDYTLASSNDLSMCMKC